MRWIKPNFTPQPDAIVARLRAGERHLAKTALIAQKYGKAAPIFLRAYAFYVEGAQKILPELAALLAL